MSCHDIGHGMNNVISHIMKLYREGQFDRPTARKLITVARESIRYCDGNEYEAIECLDNTCGCCLRDGKSGEHFYRIYSTHSLRDEITWGFLNHKIKGNSKMPAEDEFQTATPTLCADCFDRIFEHHLQENGVGAKLRAAIEEKGEAHIVSSDNGFEEMRRKIFEEAHRKAYEKAYKEGCLEVLCEAVVRDMMTLADAIRSSGCTPDEFAAWMKQFHPEYKI